MVDVINMADWVASQHANSTVRENSRRKPGKNLHLTQAQRETILDHTALPDELVARLLIQKLGQDNSRFTVEELSVLENKVGETAHFAKGRFRRKLLRVIAKLSDIRRLVQ